MNKAMENMLTRRSCRKYLDKPVPKELLEQVLLAGAYAPSAMNRQPGKVVVLRDPEEIRELEQWNSEIAGGGRVGTHMFYGAPVVLVVLAKRYSTSVEDGSLILGNLMLAAHSLGLGSCWIHRAREEFDSPRGKELLKKWGVEGDYIGVGHCILGYPDGELPKAKDRAPDFAIWR